MSILDRHIDLSVGGEAERDEMFDEIEDDGGICIEFAGIDGVIEEDVALEPIAVGDIVEDFLEMPHETRVSEASLKLEDREEGGSRGHAVERVDECADDDDAVVSGIGDGSCEVHHETFVGDKPDGPHQPGVQGSTRIIAIILEHLHEHFFRTLRVEFIEDILHVAQPFRRRFGGICLTEQNEEGERILWIFECIDGTDDLVMA